MFDLEYLPGPSGYVLLAAPAAFAILPDTITGERVATVLRAMEASGPLIEVLSSITEGRLTDLSTFLLVAIDSESGMVRVVQRPGFSLACTLADGSTQLHNADGTSIWSEYSLPITARIHVDLQTASTSTQLLPIRSGVVQATEVRWRSGWIGVSDPAPKTGQSAHDQDDGQAEQLLDEPVRDGGDHVVGDQADSNPQGGEFERHDWTLDEPYTIAYADSVADDEEGLKAEVEPLEVSGTTPQREDPDAYDVLFGATTQRTVEGAAVREIHDPGPPPPVPPLVTPPRWEGQPEAPQAAGLAQPVTGPAAMIDSVPILASAPEVPPPPLPSIDDADGLTVSAAVLRRMRYEQSRSTESGPLGSTRGPVVHAITCTGGHPNPPQSGTCRICGQSLPFQDPVTIPRPPLGVLVFAGGREVTLDRAVLVGRAPAVERVSPDDLPHLVKLDSPSKDLSRTHAEVRLEGWHVLVVDLASTNGTVVQLPGRAPERLHPSEPYPIVPGTLVTVGEEHSFVYEVRG